MTRDSKRMIVALGSCAVVIATNLVYSVDGGLALNKHCGETICGHHQYCNSDSMCDRCDNICEVKSNNYEQSNCEHYCQDYIHDHMTSYVNASTFAQLKGRVETLQVLAIVSLTLTVFLILGIILSFVWLRYRRLAYRDSDKELAAFKSKQIKNKLASVNVISNNNDAVTTENGRLALTIPPVKMAESEQGCPPSAVTTTTPLSTRYPSEDNTLEYAYDNPALTPSPASNLRRTETTF